MADDHQTVELVQSGIDQALATGNPPDKEDCNCDGEEDKKEEEKKEDTVPLISYSFGVEHDGNGKRSVSQYDCSTSPNASLISSIVAQVVNYGHQEYKDYIEANTAGFSGQDKLCLANQFGSIGTRGYEMDDGIGFYTLDEMHNCMQKNQTASGSESCRTCAPIHHYSADLLESMGAKCGLMVNQVANPDYDSSGNQSGSSRFMHYVNVCKMDGKFFLLNYDEQYQLDAMTYQEAVDIANTSLAEGNWAGNQFTCMDAGKNTLLECKHVYLSRGTRYQLSKIQDAISQVGDEQSPIHIALTNLRQEIRVAYSADSSTERITQKDGDLQETKVTHGATVGIERYRGEDFAQTGWVRRSETTVRDGETDELKRESRQDLFVGLVGSRGKDAIYLQNGDQQYSSLLVYWDRDDLYHLDDRNTLKLSYDVVGGSDLANLNLYKLGDNAGLGQANVVTVEWGNKINPMFETKVSQQFSLMTDRGNLPMPQIGQTTVKLVQNYLQDVQGIDLTNVTAIHFLHGGFSDETFAFQNTTDVSATNLGPSDLDLGLNIDVGYTTESVMGRDAFYDEGFWAEGNLAATQPIYQKGKTSLNLQVDVGFTTGSRPAQFGIDPLTIERNPTRDQVNAGYNGFIRLGGSF